MFQQLLIQNFIHGEVLFQVRLLFHADEGLLQRNRPETTVKVEQRLLFVHH